MTDIEKCHRMRQEAIDKGLIAFDPHSARAFLDQPVFFFDLNQGQFYVSIQNLPALLQLAFEYDTGEIHGMLNLVAEKEEIDGLVVHWSRSYHTSYRKNPEPWVNLCQWAAEQKMTCPRCGRNIGRCRARKEYCEAPTGLKALRLRANKFASTSWGFIRWRVFTRFERLYWTLYEMAKRPDALTVCTNFEITEVADTRPRPLPLCDKCELPVTPDNDAGEVSRQYLFVEYGEIPLLAHFNAARHFLPIKGCEGSPSRAQYIEGQPRDARDDWPYDLEDEAKYRRAYALMRHTAEIDPELLTTGVIVAHSTSDRYRVEDFVKTIRALAPGSKIDWHYDNGVIVIKAIGRIAYVRGLIARFAATEDYRDLRISYSISHVK